MLKIKNITYQPNGCNKAILKDISLQINKGDFCLLLGHNGSGKSTLLKLLALELNQNAMTGDIILCGKSIIHQTSKPKYSIRLLHQNPDDNLFGDLTVLENYYLYQSALNGGLADDFCARLSLFHPQLPDRLHTRSSLLSGGEKQALALCLNLLTPPDLLLLDEHTSALDPHSAKRLMDFTKALISKNSLTCIATTHDLNIASVYGSRLIALANGQVRFEAENPDTMRLTPQEIIEQCYIA